MGLGYRIAVSPKDKARERSVPRWRVGLTGRRTGHKALTALSAGCEPDALARDEAEPRSRRFRPFLEPQRLEGGGVERDEHAAIGVDLL